MIRSLQQATAVQNRRAENGKRGYAKAVRRFAQKHHSDDYWQVLNVMSVSWIKPESEKEEEAA